MVVFSVLLHCRKYVLRVHHHPSCADGLNLCWNRCQRSMFVARDEHEEASVIACPLPDCDHAWCKQCQQSIGFDGPEHS
jgi:hypothetical protein